MAKKTTPAGESRKSAKPPSTAGGTSLVIVESPAKARTISKFLGRGYSVEASIGHIRDLPQGAKEIPEQYKKEDWAYLGVNVNHDFEPVYVIPRQKAKQVRKLKDLLKGAKELYLATDEDREGEAISWHLCEVLRPRVPVHRLVFHEITEEAIRDALKARARSTRTWSAPRRSAGSSTGSTAMTFRRFCGGRSARGSRPAGCRAWQSG